MLEEVLHLDALIALNSCPGSDSDTLWMRESLWPQACLLTMFMSLLQVTLAEMAALLASPSCSVLADLDSSSFFTSLERRKDLLWAALTLLSCLFLGLEGFPSFVKLLVAVAPVTRMSFVN